MSARRSVPLRWVAAAMLLLALVLAGVVSRFADRDPDGLNRVAQDHGFASSAKDHPADESPFAGYAHTPLAGVVGVLVVLGLTGGLTIAVRRRVRRDQPLSDDHQPVA